MRESQLILGWIEKGMREGELRVRRDSILKVVRKLLKDPVPEDVRVAVEGTSDLDTLDRWFSAALDAEDIAAFRAAMRTSP